MTGANTSALKKCLHGVHRDILTSALLSYKIPNHRNVSGPFLPRTEVVILHHVGVAVTLLTRIREVPCSNLGQNAEYLVKFFIILLRPAIKCRDSP
jgi:hypothetical protein